MESWPPWAASPSVPDPTPLEEALRVLVEAAEDLTLSAAADLRYSGPPTDKLEAAVAAGRALVPDEARPLAETRAHLDAGVSTR